MRILLVRLMGLGDVASILVPAAYLYRERYPEASITALTYEAGEEIMQLHPEVDDVMAISKAQWPDDLMSAVQQFMQLGESIATQQFDLIVNLDTWFMPCFVTRALRDTGFTIEGNYLNQSVASFLKTAVAREIAQTFFERPGEYMESSFPRMSMWHRPWWQKAPETSYPDFYLKTCCDFDHVLRIELPCEPDQALLSEANGKPIVALSTRGRAGYKHYQHSDELVSILEGNGIFCWSQFDGSVPMRTTLNRLHASKLLVTVPTSTQWLGRLAGCPSLMLPGPMSPALLGAEFFAPQRTNCQYCYHEKECPEKRHFECMDSDPKALADQVLTIFGESQ